MNTDIEHCDSACFAARPDHLLFDAPLPGEPAGRRGLRVLLNQTPCNVTKDACCNATTGQCAHWAAGHMRSAASFTYGDYE
jgi:hypothetical protein